MFTIEQILAAHAKVKSGADFPAYVKEIKALGLDHYDFYVADGHAVYYGADDYEVQGIPKYPAKSITENSSPENLKSALKIHQQGQTDFLTFCQQAAEAGVEKWVTDAAAMEVYYVDKKGNVLVTETIPEP